MDITVQEKVERVLMENNNMIFLLAYGTPLMNEGKLHNDVGVLGDTASSDYILNVTYEYFEENGTYTIHILSQLSDILRKQTVPRQDMYIMVE